MIVSMKRILITSTDMMMVQFLLPHAKNLSENGYEVELACSEVGGRLDEVRDKAMGFAKAVHQVRLRRSPLSPTNLKGYGDMKSLLSQHHYDIIWTNEPVMGVVTRLCARKLRKHGTKVLYMAHGFHFFRGAPLLNWALFYPIERIASRWCDAISTINMQDLNWAKSFYQQKSFYTHGIGVDSSRLDNADKNRDIRAELGLKNTDVIVLSVGELNANKNHQIIIKALDILANPNVHYLICGKGALLDKLRALCRKLGLTNNVHFLGYRRDVVALCSQADIFVHPSRREGLGLAPLEAMYCGLPVIASNIRGPQDFVKNGLSGYLIDKEAPHQWASAIKSLIDDSAKRKTIGEYNKSFVLPFCIDNVKKEVLQVLESL